MISLSEAEIQNCEDYMRMEYGNEMADSVRPSLEYVMRKIKLANNKGIVLVDDEDYEFLSQYNWVLCSGRYAGARMNGKVVYLHRVVMLASKGQEIDHINRNTLDNRKCNLRFVTHSQNMRNLGINKRNKSGYRGVSWDKKHKKYGAFFGKKFLGYFDNPEDASIAYNVYFNSL